MTNSMPTHGLRGLVGRAATVTAALATGATLLQWSCTSLLGDDFVVDGMAAAGAGAASGGTGGVGAAGGTTGEAGTGGTGASGSGGMGGSCDLETHRCVPDPGPYWSAPFAIAEQATGCGGAYPSEIGPLRDELVVPTSSCACGCGQPSVSCPSTMSVVGYAGSGCTSAQGYHDLVPGDCYSKLPASASHELEVSGPQASCAAGTVSDTIPAPSWDVELVACAAASAGTCGNPTDHCVAMPADPFQPSVCVLRGGEFACPPGYPNAVTYYQNVADDRACPTSCTCSASGARCRVSVTNYSATGCANSLGSGWVWSDDPSCLIDGNVVSFRPGTPDVGASGSCAGADPNPMGAATPDEIVTVCCT